VRRNPGGEEDLRAGLAIGRGGRKNRVVPSKKYIIDCIPFFRHFSKNKKRIRLSSCSGIERKKSIFCALKLR